MFAPDPMLLQSLGSHAGMLVMELDTHGKIIWFSQAMAKLTGMSIAEARGVDWVEHFVPETERASVRRVCRGKVGELRHEVHVKPFIAGSGEERLVEWVHADLRSPEGDIRGILCIGRDVTELEQTRKALVSSQQLSDAVMETAVNAIITMGEDRCIQTINRATETLFGFTREELVGQNVKILMPEPYRHRHDGYVDQYRRTGVKKIIGIGREVIGQRKDGSTFPIDLSVGEAKLPDGRRVFTGIIRDLSDRKALEEKILQISESEQTRIGRDIHDDLCQQLAAIGCLAKVAEQSLSKKCSEEEVGPLKEIVRMISSANARAREMSRGLVPVVLDANGLMGALRELVQGTERIFRVSCAFHCNHPVEVRDNKIATQLYRIAQEAVANAVKHSSATRIEVTLRGDAGYYLLSVGDNGTGILEHVAGSSKGMGLLTMQHRARMVGGVLSIEHDDFGGTLVQCRVPIPNGE
jgi:PAS domain S-box-containing protein